jgi:hypothetical protein
MQLVGTHEGGPKEVGSAHPGSPILSEVGQPGGTRMLVAGHEAYRLALMARRTVAAPAPAAHC